MCHRVWPRGPRNLAGCDRVLETPPDDPEGKTPVQPRSLRLAGDHLLGCSGARSRKAVGNAEDARKTLWYWPRPRSVLLPLLPGGRSPVRILFAKFWRIPEVHRLAVGFRGGVAAIVLAAQIRRANLGIVAFGSSGRQLALSLFEHVYCMLNADIRSLRFVGEIFEKN